MFAEFADSDKGPWIAAPCHIINNEFTDPDDPEDEGYVEDLDGGWRNYKLFGILAEVRDSGCIYEPRGVPNNMSNIVKKAYEFWNGDGHTYSWLTLAEFKKCLTKAGFSGWKKADANLTTDFNKPHEEWPNYVNIVAYCQKILDDMKADAILLGRKSRPVCRLIFWFDN